MPVGARPGDQTTAFLPAGGAHPAAPPSARPYPPGGYGPRSDPSTDEFGAYPPVRPNHRSERRVGFVVLGLVIIGALVAAGLLVSSHHGSARSTSGSSTGSTGGGGSALHVSGVRVFMVNDRPPDNPDLTPRTFDGNPSTYWQSAVYTSPRFGNLYPGIGLAIDLGSSAALHTLTVTSPTAGWAASAYVSSTDVANGQPVSSWGSPTATKSGIGGDTTFTLSGRHGRYVLLWITYLGPADTIKIAELGVS